VKIIEKPRGESRGVFFDHPFFLGCLLIAAAVFILYSFSFGHNFLFDEENIILKNPFLADWRLIPELLRHGYFYFDDPASGGFGQYYRPLTSLTFFLDRQIWGLDPLGYNLTNTFLHILTSLLLFRLVWKVCGCLVAGFLAALVWSAHPIHTEAVTYIASRGDVLASSLLLGSLLFYWNGRKRGALLCYALSLFSKESAILLPFYLLILELCFLKNSVWKKFKNIGPFAGIAVLFFVFRKCWAPVPLGPVSFDFSESALRVFSMGGAFLNYLSALGWPESFKFGESVSFAASFWDARVGTTLSVTGLLSAALVFAFRRSKAVFFGLALFLTALLPYSQVIHFYPEWSEHYLYFASMGLAIPGAFGIRAIFESHRRVLIAVFLIFYFLFLIFLGFRTWQRNVLYNHTFGFYQRLAASDSPYAFYGYQNMARLFIERGHWDEAIVPLKTALAIEPHSDIAHNLLGLYYLQKKEIPRAAAHFEEAYQHSGGDLRYRMNVGICQARLGDYSKALEIFKDIQRKSPDNFSVYINLISVSELAGDRRRALAWAVSAFKKFRQRQTQSVALAMAVARLAYRQGWDSLATSRLRWILKKYPNVFWYSDVAGLLTGKITPNEFMEIVQAKYLGFDSTAKLYILMSFVLLQKEDLAVQFFQENREVIESQAQNHPLIALEVDRFKTKHLPKWS
jgi:tetratricopeptide (TPR) repeat protein